VRTRVEIGFKDRFEDQFHRRLHHPIFDRCDAEWACPTCGLRDIHPSHGLESVGLRSELLVHFPDHLPLLSTCYDRLNRLPIDAGCPVVGLDLLPRLPEDILTPHLVIERIKCDLLSLFGLGIEGPLQLPNCVCCVGSHTAITTSSTALNSVTEA